jgi:hypothetical protein
MFVKFLHRDADCSAYIVCPSGVQDTITVYILDFNSELGYEVIFTKGAMSDWDTNENIKIKYPSTYHALCEKLHEFFPGSKFIENDKEYAEEFAA